MEADVDRVMLAWPASPAASPITTTREASSSTASRIAPDEIHTISLQSARNGNLPLRNIGRAKF
jgi:hypothetical protein